MGLFIRKIPPLIRKLPSDIRNPPLHKFIRENSHFIRKTLPLIREPPSYIRNPPFLAFEKWTFFHPPQIYP